MYGAWSYISGGSHNGSICAEEQTLAASSSVYPTASVSLSRDAHLKLVSAALRAGLHGLQLLLSLAVKTHDSLPTTQ